MLDGDLSIQKWSWQLGNTLVYRFYSFGVWRFRDNWPITRPSPAAAKQRSESDEHTLISQHCFVLQFNIYVVYTTHESLNDAENLRTILV